MEKHILDQINPKALGARLQEARKARGMTQPAVGLRHQVVAGGS